ncbi:MAG TPA: NAD-dependent epimerase/dehydratase family protein [Anaerolineae bacterium]|nr:NAD-dependent epimerase/dehydratase family protein [Anaerolineae bacterium]
MNLDGRKVLVTGGAGFIGSHLVQALLARGARVSVVDNLTTGSPTNLRQAGTRVELIQMDINCPDFEALVAQGFDVICHFAGNAYVPASVEDPQTDFDVNLRVAFRILETIRQSKLDTVLLYPSSAAVYGSPRQLPITESSPLAPISPYGVSKLAAERYIAVYSEIYGVRGASLRLFSCYGPRQRKQIVYDFIHKLDRNPKQLLIYGDGTQERDFCFVDDTVEAALIVLERGKLQGEVYNVASGRSCSTAELAHLVAESMELTPELRFTGQVRPGDAQIWRADISRLQVLGYRPQVSLEEGIARTLRWYREQGK